MNIMLPEQISELKLQSKQFRRTDPETYARVLREYAPVFDKYVAIDMYIKGIPPPRCEVCDARISVSKKQFKRCVTHSRINDTAMTYDAMCLAYPGTYVPWDGVKSRSDKIGVICPEHGVYYQVLRNRMHGMGCQKCYFKKKLGMYRVDRDDYLRRFSEVHKGFYDYSLVDIQGSENKIEIICPTHGSFWQAPIVHINGHGCPGCAKDAHCLKMQCDHERQLRRNFMAEYIKYNDVKTKNTSIELALKRYLDVLEIEYEQQYIIDDEYKNKWAYDFYIPSRHLLVETDGEYWHTSRRAYRRDTIKGQAAALSGYHLLRLSDLSLDFSKIWDDYDKIAEHTRAVMDRRVNILRS